MDLSETLKNLDASKAGETADALFDKILDIETDEEDQEVFGEDSWGDTLPALANIISRLSERYRDMVTGEDGIEGVYSHDDLTEAFEAGVALALETLVEMGNIETLERRLNGQS